jgi:C4-dicarboxylate-specific signal transduction histidine kinase
MKNVSPQTEAVERLPVILGNRVQLKQVLLNLLLNAVEAMRALAVGYENWWSVLS